MNEIELLEKRLMELSELYKKHWALACSQEGAEATALCVEFTAGNVDAIACVEIMKEMSQIKTALKSNILRRYKDA